MTDIAQLITQMQQSDFYPHAVNQKIELIQTHASYIFLTGKFAYKVKKNVDFGFLDYSTLAKRKHFLTTELRLNQEIAPELYLAIIPIYVHDKQLVLGVGKETLGKEIFEYTLKMRQFPQENLFTNLLAANKLNGDRFRELGKIVARFHQTAKTNKYICSFGSVAKIRIAFDENYHQTQKYIGTVQTKEQLQATKTYTDTFFQEQEDLFKSRIKQGKIKECHGDLHLKNICLWQDKIQLFDRLEFNESFRFVDTIYDVAFTVMDLEARQQFDFANAFLNSYLEYTGDWQGLLLLPLYLSRQAYVRAKVNSLLLDEPEINEATKQTAKQDARNYYQQAYQYTQAKSGSLILMSGLSGSGKSTVAQEIARQQRGIQIRSDAVRKHLAGISLEESGTDSLYSVEMTQKTYDRLLELGIILAQAGFTIILDAKYDRRVHRQKAITQANRQHIPLKIIQCVAPAAVLRDRLNKRQEDVSDATADLITTQQLNAEAFTAMEKAYIYTVDTTDVDWQNKIIDLIGN